MFLVNMFKLSLPSCSGSSHLSLSSSARSFNTACRILIYLYCFLFDSYSNKTKCRQLWEAVEAQQCFEPNVNVSMLTFANYQITTKHAVFLLYFVVVCHQKQGIRKTTMLTWWWHYMGSEGITKVATIHPKMGMNICTKFRDNPSDTFRSKPQRSTSWWEERESQRTTNVIRIHHLGAMHVCLFKDVLGRCWEISQNMWKLETLLVEEKSGDC